MPKRLAKPRFRERYVSKEYKAYRDAHGRMCLIENFSASLVTTVNRRGFASRFLGRPEPKPMLTKTREELLASIPPLRPYRRHDRYSIPAHWPKPFVPRKEDMEQYLKILLKHNQEK